MQMILLAYSHIQFTPSAIVFLYLHLIQYKIIDDFVSVFLAVYANIFLYAVHTDKLWRQPHILARHYFALFYASLV